MDDGKNQAPAAASPPASLKPPTSATVPAPAGALVVPPNNPGTATEKSADKPHKITIGLGLLGLLSPIVAVIALYISIQALRTNEHSLEIGQRAYVSMQDG